jgi:hypothetical protein
MKTWSGRSFSQSLAIFGLAAAGLLAALPSGPASGPVAAVFPPWWDAGRTFQAAAEGGPILRLGAARFVVLVAPLGASGRERLRRAGAWLLLSPLGLSGCRSTINVK